MTQKKFKFLIGILAMAGSIQTGWMQSGIISDFNDGVPDWVVENNRIGNATFQEMDGKLTISGTMPATGESLGNSIAGLGWAHNSVVSDAQTIEYRVELLQTSREDVIANIQYNTSEQGLYAMGVNANRVFLLKVFYGGPIVFSAFFWDEVSLPTTNVTLVLALTGVGDNVRIDTRVLDLADPSDVLFERSVLDSPGIDPTVSELPDGRQFQPDSGPPFHNGISAFLSVSQISDGNQPRASVQYDNFVFEHRNAAVLAIQRAVQLSWPAFSTPFIVEKSVGVDGPWEEATEPVFQVDGMNLMTVPVSTATEATLFRLKSP